MFEPSKKFQPMYTTLLHEEVTEQLNFTILTDLHDF